MKISTRASLLTVPLLVLDVALIYYFTQANMSAVTFLDAAGHQRAMLRELLLRQHAVAADSDIKTTLLDNANTLQTEFGHEYSSCHSIITQILDSVHANASQVYTAINTSDAFVKSLSAKAQLSHVWLLIVHTMLVLFALGLMQRVLKHKRDLQLKAMLMDNVPIGMVTIKDKRFTYANIAFQKLYNVPWHNDDDSARYTHKIRQALPHFYGNCENADAHTAAMHEASQLQHNQSSTSCDLWMCPRDMSQKHRVRLQSHNINGTLCCYVLDVSREHELVQQEKMASLALIEKSTTLEAQERYEHMCRAADNHIMHNCKNIFIGVKDNLHTEMQPSAIKDAVMASLTQGINICHDREFFNLVEQGDYIINNQCVNMKQFISSVQNLYNITASTDIEGYMLMDLKVVQCVLRDAILNAKRHGTGGITCCATRVADADMCLIQVTNDVNTSTSQTVHSTGIGIKNAFKCAQSVGYDMTFEVHNNTAEFNLTVPYASSSPPRSAVFQNIQRPLTVAVLDDSELIRVATARSLENILDDSEHMLVAGATESEIRNFAEAAMGFGVVVIDFNLEMHNFNGHDVLIQMRTRGFTGPIIVRSANDTEHDQQTYLQMGFDACMHKTDSVADQLSSIIASDV